MSTHDTIVSSEKIEAIADAILAKTGGSSPMTLDEMAQEIAGISGGDEYKTMLVKMLTKTIHGAFSIPAALGLTEIGVGAFYKISGSSVQITVPDGVTSIGAQAFAESSVIQKISLPASVQSIGQSAFYNNTMCTEIDIPVGSQITSMGTYLCSGCGQLTKFVIPSGVSSLGSRSFNNCTNLANLYCYPTTPPTLPDRYTVPNQAMTIHVPSGCASAYQAATNWAALTNATFVEDL